MAKSLLIHFPDANRDFATWGTVDNEQPLEATGFASGTLQEAAEAAQGQRSVVAIGSSSVTLTRVKIPGGGSAKRAREATPFALEEQLADDVEDLHFALGPVGSDGGYPVAVIARSMLLSHLEQLAEAGIYPQEVVPDVLLLPLGDSDEWQVVQTADDMLIRQGSYAGMWCPTASAELMLNRLVREAGVDGPTQITFYLPPGQEPAPFEILSEHVPVENTADALTRGINAHRINLLQGEFNQKKALDKLWKPWRLPGALAACMLCLSVGSSILESNALAVQESEQRAQMESLLKQTFPGVKRVNDPIARMRSELRKLKTGGSDGKLMPLVAALSDAVKALPNTTMNSVNFRNGRADVDMKTDSLQTLDKIKQSLDATKGVKASIQSANQQDGAVRGRLRIEAG